MTSFTLSGDIWMMGAATGVIQISFFFSASDFLKSKSNHSCCLAVWLLLQVAKGNVPLPPATLRCFSWLGRVTRELENESLASVVYHRAGWGPSLWRSEAGNNVISDDSRCKHCYIFAESLKSFFFFFLSQAFQHRGEMWELKDPRSLCKEDL